MKSDLESGLTIASTRRGICADYAPLAMRTKTLILKDVPSSVDLEIGNAIIDYSVAMCRIRGDNSRSFTPLGSGTFVTRNGMHGILTAHHCIHACNPAVSIGAQGKDTLLLVVTRSRCVFLDPCDAKEHPLGIPLSDESGPDLTFIEIFPGPKLDLLKAIVSFWNLDQKHYELAKELSAPGIIIVEAGFPEIDYRTEIVESTIHHELSILYLLADLETEICLSKDVGTTLDRDASIELLKKYQGLSKALVAVVYGLSGYRSQKMTSGVLNVFA